MRLTMWMLLRKPKFDHFTKKDGRTEKSNYRPISVLSNVSKIYVTCLYDQTYSYFNKIFPRYLCSFRKGNSTENILSTMTENNRVPSQFMK